MKLAEYKMGYRHNEIIGEKVTTMAALVVLIKAAILQIDGGQIRQKAK
ncbi:hypothetical protein GN156_33865 [bacterium LRH843]|nr:hypothetical protein [bacterium LRH843]